MEVVFWKHQIALWGLLVLCSLVLIGAIVFTILIFSSNFNFVVACVWWILLIIGLLGLFLDKKLLSKIVFSEECIKCTRLNKEIMYFKWEDIREVTDTVHGNCTNYLTFIVNNTQVHMDLTKKMYNTIMEICPIANIKFLINNIEDFKYYHRNKN